MKKIAISSNDNKIIPSINSIETYAHETSKDFICKEEKINRISITKQYKNVYSIMLQRRHKRT